MSGRNSLSSQVNTLNPMLMPKLTAPSPAERVLAGCQARDTNAPAVNPDIRETET